MVMGLSGHAACATDRDPTKAGQIDNTNAIAILITASSRKDRAAIGFEQN